MILWEKVSLARRVQILGSGVPPPESAVAGARRIVLRDQAHGKGGAPVALAAAVARSTSGANAYEGWLARLELVGGDVNNPFFPGTN